MKATLADGKKNRKILMMVMAAVVVLVAAGVVRVVAAVVAVVAALAVARGVVAVAALHNGIELKISAY